MSNLKNIKDLVDLFGGSLALAYELKINQYNVDRWEIYGIPIRYWPQLMELLEGLTPEVLYKITMQARSKRHQGKPTLDEK